MRTDREWAVDGWVGRVNLRMERQACSWDEALADELWGLTDVPAWLLGLREPDAGA